MSAFLVLSTAPDLSTARKIVRKILLKRQAACAHVGGIGESHYWWNGKLEKAREVPLTFKTSKKALPLLMQTLKQSHSYETPEILALRVDQGDASYLKWLTDEVRPKNRSKSGRTPDP